MNFGLAELFKGNCNLRFDDTNPTTENITYVNSIIDSLSWLGFKAKPLYASDYFDLLYEYALIFIKNNLAYVDSNPYEKIKELNFQFRLIIFFRQKVFFQQVFYLLHLSSHL